MDALKGGSAVATLRMLRISPWKLNLVAKSIRGMNPFDALNKLFSIRKRAARDIEKLLKSVIANAENNSGLDIEQMYIAEASVGKNISLKRLDIKGRSRSGRIVKQFSQMRIVLLQLQEEK